MITSVLLFAVAVAGYRNATAAPLVRRLNIRLADYPATAAPVRIVLFSDLHVHGPDMPPERVAKIVSQINALHPDIDVAAGDFLGDSWIGKSYPVRQAIAPLSGLKARLGVYAVLGNGFKNWRTSIGDITASARWLVAQGIAAPDRLAILGWSYGGYAALQSAATEPALYKAVVAIAPVTDLAQLKSDAHDFTNRNLVERDIGVGPHVVEGSPFHRANDIQAPVLLFHGDHDSNVNISQSQKMEAALKALNRDTDMVTFSGLDHQLDDSDARTQMLVRIGQFLDRAIGQ